MEDRPDPDRVGQPPAVPALGRELALTAKVVRAWVDDAFARQGSSLATWILLQHAAASERPPSQRELAGSMSIGGATLVRQIDRLEADGLVRRDPDPRDRRVTRISLTESGREHFGELVEIARTIDAELRSLVSEREERVFRSVLDRLRTYTAQPTSTPSSGATPGETEVA